MPIDTYQPQHSLEEQKTRANIAPGYYQRPGFEAQQRLLSDADFHEAPMGQETLAELQRQREATIDLSEAPQVDTTLFDAMNREANGTGAYHEQPRETVASPRAETVPQYTIEHAKVSIIDGTYLPRLTAIAGRVEHKRNQLTLAA